MNVGQRVVILIGGVAFCFASLVPPWRARLPLGVSEFAGYGPVWDGPRWSVKSDYPEFAIVDSGRLGALLTGIAGLTLALALAIRTRKNP